MDWWRGVFSQKSVCFDLVRGITYIVIKELHDKRGHAAINTDEEVDASQHYIRCAGHIEDEWCRVHHGSDGPP